MLFMHFRVYNEVIYIHYNIVYALHYKLNQPLKGRGSRSQAHRNHLPFELPHARDSESGVGP
jgi:hypothetical protein